MGDGGSNQRNAFYQPMDGIGVETPLLLIQSKRIYQRGIFQKIRVGLSKPPDRSQTGDEFH